MSRITDISQRGIYPDLLRKFCDEGHNVYIIAPRERSLHLPTGMVEADNVHILGVRTLNLQKTSAIEKGLGQVLVESQYRRAIKRYLQGVSFDLILYSTPPITFPGVIKFMKHRNPEAKTFLLLKDIFPQNAIDLGMMSKTGLKGILYRYFRRKEKLLYRLSDGIGCMSPANVDYILKHNPEISANKVDVAPNSIALVDTPAVDKAAIRQKYSLPTDRPIFIYGGNLGRPQGIPFLIKCLDANANRSDCHFLVIGTGTELQRLKEWAREKRPVSVTIMDGLPRLEYEELARSCDVGLIFLDHRFTIPNYPSRLLPYLENKMPVLAATDTATDIGRIAERNGYGYWCESNVVESFTEILNKMIESDRSEMGQRGYDFLLNNYLVENTFNAIMRYV